MGKFKNIAGQRFGRLIAIQIVGQNATRNFRWSCQCDCGNTCVVSGGHLVQNVTQSCGCLVKENQGGPPKHGYARRGKAHPLHTIWNSMRQRCTNPNNAAFKNYGGRGIKVCERWDDFTNFLADMGDRPHPKMVLDRINNEGNYEPSNCHCTDRKRSAGNRRLQKTRGGRDSKLKGVYWQNNRWRAVIMYNYTRFYLGSFKSKEAAHAAWWRAAREIYGQDFDGETTPHPTGALPTVALLGRAIGISGFRGVTRNGKNWSARVARRSVGTFKSPELAARALAIEAMYAYTY